MVPTRKDWIAFIVVIASAVVFLAFPYRILESGFLPPDDALRYAARAVSGKSWGEIILMRPEISIDHNPGWNWLLGTIHGATGWGPKQLVNFSVIATFAVFSIVPMFWLRRPESWIAAITILLLVFPYFAERLMVGRPLWLTAAATIILLCLWREDPAKERLRRMCIWSAGLIGLCVWIHGSWYLFAMVPFSFFAARRWRAALCLTVCWLAGSAAGAVLTGTPWKYLYESALIPFLALNQAAPLSAMAGEFKPYTGGYAAVAIVGVILGLRVVAGSPLKDVTRNPMLWLAVIGWILGFKVFRFWLDWGLPALAVWMAFEFQELAKANKNLSEPGARFAVLGAAAFLLLGVVSSDKEKRWSRFSDFESMDLRQAEHAGWLPDKGGILYAVNMSVFYQTFYTNPRGEWRYALGFEPSFMRPEDYSVYLELWETLNALKAVQPWVAKMTVADRLVLLGSENTRPAIPELEWKYVVRDTWVGRRARSAAR